MWGHGMGCWLVMKQGSKVARNKDYKKKDFEGLSIGWEEGNFDR